MLLWVRCAIFTVLAMLAVRTGACQCLPAVCALTIQLQSNATGLALGNSGSSSATASFGTITALAGTVPAGVTRTVSASSFTISTPFGVYVTCTNLVTLLPCTILVSPSYVLLAELQSADATNTWKIGSSTLSSSSPVTLTSSGTFASVSTYTFSLTIPFSEASTTLNNSVNFLAIAN